MSNGEDSRIPRAQDKGDDEGPLRPQHTMMAVYGSMLRQICLDYATLPDPRTLTMSEIRFFYEGLRPSLRVHTKPRGTK